ncbi:MAG: isocitrate/isopropylmalate dehydrogenase family protein [Clostridiales bacterium]|nr:isocitrate/isopropylmalate dehydrogenase family protein [Clostridiales bacterium]
MYDIESAKEQFGRLLVKHLERAERIKNDQGATDYQSLDTIVIGALGGDGIGPAITNQAVRVMKHVLQKEIESGKVEIRMIDGLTIEKRVEENRAIPAAVLDEIKKCHVVLKGPTTTPRKGDPWPNIESANVAMRKELDLFANVRPVSVPEEGIDWTFFRENTEGGYAAGKEGVVASEDVSIDFTIATTPGCERIIRAAFAFAKANGKKRVTAVTKANIIKATDGKFLDIFYQIAKEYPEIAADDWYIDIMTAKLIDKKRRSDFEVFVLPNLYGDILTDEAAELQGGVGTAGSANLGSRYAMFEAIHGSAPRMVQEGREIYADPSSVIRAAAMLLRHIGYIQEAAAIDNALAALAGADCPVKITGRDTGSTSEAYTDYLISKL